MSYDNEYDKKLPETGVRVYKPSDNAPDFIAANVVVDPKVLFQYIKDEKAAGEDVDKLEFSVKISGKTGGWYVAKDDWRKRRDQQGQKDDWKKRREQQGHQQGGESYRPEPPKVEPMPWDD
jgi:hypothetical protein